MPGIPKLMPSSSSSTTVSDALANLTKAATLALNAVQGAQGQAHTDVMRALAERDDALKALHDAQLDAKDLEVREEVWKAAMDKSNLTIKHQAETIAQLRVELQQWKTQLTRLEDSSRQEIDGWKEQYRRAEHERSGLSARIEELIAGQLAWNAAAHAYTAPFTPRIAYADLGAPASSSTKRASTGSHRTGGTPHTNGCAHAGEDDAPLTMPRKSKGPQSSRTTAHTDRQPRSRGGSPIRPSAARRKDAGDGPLAGSSRGTPRTPAARNAPVPTQAQPPPRTQLIRRVTAIVDVKEEEDSDGAELESAASGSMYDPDDEPLIPPRDRQRRASNADVRHKRVVQDEWDDEGEVGPEDAEEEDEEAEDDELLLGPKTQSRRPPRTQHEDAKQPRTKAGVKASGPTKKRKVDADGNAPSGRAGPAKSAKTR